MDPGCNYTSPDIAEIFSNGDFDWITLDLEHVSFNNETIVTIIDQLNKEVKYHLFDYQKVLKKLKNALEAGASGLIIPMIKNNNELKKSLVIFFLLRVFVALVIVEPTYLVKNLMNIKKNQMT